jgi:hypothetical protein
MDTSDSSQVPQLYLVIVSMKFVDEYRDVSQIEHSRHRSPVNFLVNLLCGLIARSHQPKKPSLTLDFALPYPA